MRHRSRGLVLDTEISFCPNKEGHVCVSTSNRKLGAREGHTSHVDSLETPEHDSIPPVSEGRPGDEHEKRLTFCNLDHE